MVISKQTVLLGTNNISESNKVLVYNTNTFNSKEINNVLGLNNSDISILKNPNISTINQIYSILIKYPEYIPLEISEKTKTECIYVFNNSKMNIINGQGFNVLIFLKNNEIIGFIELLDVQGCNKIDRGSYMKLKRSYVINYISIGININNKGLRIDKDNIKLINDLSQVNFDNLPFYKKSSKIYNKKIDLTPNYNNSLFDILNGSLSNNIINNNFYCKGDIDPNKFQVSKLNLRKDLTISDIYTNFEHYQVGYYNGDISIFIWNNNNEYSIFSLSKTLGDLFDNDSPKLMPYTIPRVDKDGYLVSNTEIYKLPNLYNNKPDIVYFSGKYIICKIKGMFYLFDIERQSGKTEDSSLLNNGWIISNYKLTGNYKYFRKLDNKWIPIEKPSFPIKKIYDSLDFVPKEDYYTAIKEKVPEFCHNFMIDLLDPFNELRIFKQDIWNNYDEAVYNCPELSNTYINSREAFMNGGDIVKKIGSWIVLENKYTYIKTYTNLTKAVKFRLDEEPLIVNDQIILGKHENDYTIYDEDGYFMSPLALEQFISKFGSSSIKDNESFNETYTIYNSIDNPSKFSKLSSETSPIELDYKFWKFYRKNFLPNTLENLTILGGLGGIIFYKLKNKINYL